MASETVTAEVIKEMQRPELFGLVYYNEELEEWIVFVRPEREHVKRQQTTGTETFFRLPGSSPAPAPAPDRRDDELLREANRLLRWFLFEQGRSTSMTAANMEVDGAAWCAKYLAATAPAPPGEGAGR